MANDVDVKIGIQVEGDTSGAQAVEKALDGVKQSAGAAASAASTAAGKAAAAGQEAATAASQAAQESSAEVAGLNSAVSSLLDSLSGLSRRDATNALNGIASALKGISSGDISTGLSGAAVGLGNIARVMPNPAVAIALAGGIALIVKAFEAFTPPTRELNEFGETVEQERARLDKLAKEKVEWSGIAAGLDAVKANFDEANKSAQALLNATQSIFSAKNAAAISALQRQASAAEKAGDVEGAASLRSQAERIGQIDELVKVGIKIQENQTQQTNELKQLSGLQQALRDTLAAAQAQQDKVSAIEAQIVSRSGNLDAAKEGSFAQADLITKTAKLLQLQEMQAAGYAPIPTPEFGPPMSKRDMAEAAKETEMFLESLKNLSDEQAAVTDTASKATESQKEYDDALDSAAQRLVILKGELEALNESMRSLSEASGPDIADAASRQVQAIADANQAYLEQLTATGNTAEQVVAIVDSAIADIDAVATRAEPAAQKLKDAVAQMWDSETTQQLDAAQQNAQKYRDVLEAIGSGLQISGAPDPAVVRQSIEDTRAAFGDGAAALRDGGDDISGAGGQAAGQISAAGQALKSALSGTGQAAAAVTGQVNGIASDFRDKLNVAARDMAAAGTGLARMASEFNATISRLSAEIAATRQMAAAAAATSDLALSQIRNYRT